MCRNVLRANASSFESGACSQCPSHRPFSPLFLPSAAAGSRSISEPKCQWQPRLRRLQRRCSAAAGGLRPLRTHAPSVVAHAASAHTLAGSGRVPGAGCGACGKRRSGEGAQITHPSCQQPTVVPSGWKWLWHGHSGARRRLQRYACCNHWRFICGVLAGVLAG